MNKRIEDHRDESGEPHRIDGPAIVYSDGSKFWCRHGRYHRRGGAAVMWEGGDAYWWVNRRRLHAPKVLPERAHGIMELFL